MAGARGDRRLGAGAVLLGAFAVVAVMAPARAQAPVTPRVSGGAHALSATALSAVIVPPTPAGVAGSGTDGFPLVHASSPPVGMPGVVGAAGLGASTEARSGTVTSQAVVDSLSLGGDLLTAGSVTSSCSAAPSASTGTAAIAALSLGGVRVPANPAANTPIEIPGVLRGTLNEQVPEQFPGGSGVVVRAVHVTVQVTSPTVRVLDVVVAESRCAAANGTFVEPPSPTMTTSVAPSTTAPVRTTTTLALVSTTVTTAVATTSSTTAPPAPPAPLVVDAATADGRRSGPSGAELNVTASGFAGCDDVQILFDGRRIGVGHPDAGGRLAERRLSVPGDSRDGRHQVTATCEASSRTLRAAAAFQVVTSSAVHRSALVTALAEPYQVGTSARSLLLSSVGALGLLLAVAFPCELFNSTLDENYDEVRGWFGFRRPHHDDSARHQIVEFVAFVLLGGALYGLLSPDFGFDRSSLALALGLAVSLVVVSIGFRLPHMLYVHHHDGEWPKLRVLPGTALVAIVCVAVSRLVHFQPGYLYGLIAGLAFRRQLAADANGELTAVSALSVFAIGIAAWVARVPVAAAVSGDNPSMWLVTLEACLAATCILGIETVVICLIPLRFVDGSKLAAWSRTAWAAVFALVAFGFVHILLRPDSGYVASASSRLTVVVLFVAFGLLSVGFWAYFRFRPVRAPAPAA